MGEALQLQALQLRQGKYSKESSVYHKRKSKDEMDPDGFISHIHGLCWNH